MAAAPLPRLTIRQLTPSIGAVIEGVDIAKPLDPETLAQIQDALVKYRVIFFQNQDLAPEAHREFASRFGTLHIHPIYPNVKEVPEIMILDHGGDGLDPTTNRWHTDVTFIKNPPLGSILAAKILPPTGGDTLWSSSIAAFRGLSPPLQTMLRKLTAVHDFTMGFTYEMFGRHNEAFLEAVRKNPPVTHPVVRVHPVSGEEGIFVNSIFTSHIVELSKSESQAMLAMLYEHCSKPEFTVRWHWSLGDVAFWDNRLTQHYATADYLPERRMMYRATILGDVPRGPNDAN